MQPVCKLLGDISVQAQRKGTCSLRKAWPLMVRMLGPQVLVIASTANLVAMSIDCLRLYAPTSTRLFYHRV